MKKMNEMLKQINRWHLKDEKPSRVLSGSLGKKGKYYRQKSDENELNFVEETDSYRSLWISSREKLLVSFQICLFLKSSLWLPPLLLSLQLSLTFQLYSLMLSYCYFKYFEGTLQGETGAGGGESERYCLYFRWFFTRCSSCATIKFPRKPQGLFKRIWNM